RFQIMVSEQNADGFPAHARHQLPLHGFLSDEPHTPACLPRWWLATDPGDDTLALARVQPPLLARARLLVQRRLQPLLLIAPGNRSHSFPDHAHVASHLRRCLSLIKLAQNPTLCSASRLSAAAPSSSVGHAPDDRFACPHYRPSCFTPEVPT